MHKLRLKVIMILDQLKHLLSKYWQILKKQVTKFRCAGFYLKTLLHIMHRIEVWNDEIYDNIHTSCIILKFWTYLANEVYKERIAVFQALRMQKLWNDYYNANLKLISYLKTKVNLQQHYAKSENQKTLTYIPNRQ